MPIIITVLLAGIGWILAAIVFEAAWHEFRRKSPSGFNKGTACRIWWALLGLLSGLSGPVAFFVNLPLLLAIGLSHIQLAHSKDEIITVAEIIGNIGPALRDASARIKPFLK